MDQPIEPFYWDLLFAVKLMAGLAIVYFIAWPPIRHAKRNMSAPGSVKERHH